MIAIGAVTLVLALAFAIALPGPALAAPAQEAACVCSDEPLDERLDAADAAIVARFVQQADTTGDRRVLVFEVEQRVKGDVSGTVEVRSPVGTDCDLEVREAQAVGLLLTREASGTWLATACSVVDPGRLVAAGGEARGSGIKVVVGIVILGLVLALAFYRLRRGSRPQLPGAPDP